VQEQHSPTTSGGGQNVRDFEQAIERVVTGEWTPDRFVSWLEEKWRKLEIVEEALRSIEIPFGCEEEFEDEQVVGFAGIDCYRAGMEEMRLFAADASRAHLDAGLISIREGNRLINEAMRLNREKRMRDEAAGAGSEAEGSDSDTIDPDYA